MKTDPSEGIGIAVRSKGSPLVRTLRTFQSDAAAESLKTTKLEILMAQRTRNEGLGLSRVPEKETSHHFGRTIFLLSLLLAFSIGVGIYALIGTTIFSPSPSKKSPQEQRPVEVSDALTLQIGKSSREQILAAIANIFRTATLARGEMRVIQFTANDSAGATVAASARATLSAIVIGTPPEILLHSLDAVFTYGVYASKDPVGFFKMRSRSYAETFSGMLKWEGTMNDALAPALNPNMTKNESAALRGRTFRDERIAETPARVLSDPDGTVVIAYAFLDPQTLFIAGGREALQALIEQSK